MVGFAPAQLIIDPVQTEKDNRRNERLAQHEVMHYVLSSKAH